MRDDNWAEIDAFVADLFVNPDPALDAALAASKKAGLPEIEVSAPAGKLLYLLAKIIGARKILEIGTLGGYSTIWLARALPKGGRLISLEYNPKHAEIARKSIAGAGLADRAEVRVGKALDSLPQIEAAGEGPFDFFFIDADKPNNPAYFEWALKLSRKGSIIVVDNVIRGGAVVRFESDDASVRGSQRFLKMMAKEKRVSATAIQTVGAKGHDGFSIAVVTE
jgi:predicted O-methyltransferase YrrM